MIPADELRQIWNSQQDSERTKGKEKMLALVIEKTRTLDRKVAARNARECLAGVFVAAIFAWEAWNAPSQLERLGMAVVSLTGAWYAYYLPRYGRGPRRLDAGASLTAYQELLREGYDEQIRLLRSVKYWAILPAYLGVLLAKIGTGMRLAAEGKNPWTNVISMAIVTTICVAVWFLMEFRSVPRLQRLKEDLSALKGRSGD
jgi:hypothetical protein